MLIWTVAFRRPAQIAYKSVSESVQWGYTTSSGSLTATGIGVTFPVL